MVKYGLGWPPIKFAQRPYHLPLHAARVNIVTAEEIARLEDVDRYIYNYQRVIELAQEGKTVTQISFVTNLRPHLVREQLFLLRDILDSHSSPY